MNAHIKSAGEPGAPRCSEAQPGSNPSSGRSAALARFASDDFQYRLRDNIAKLATTRDGVVHAPAFIFMTRDDCVRLVESLNEASERAASHPDLCDDLSDLASWFDDIGILTASTDAEIVLDRGTVARLVNLLTCAADVLAMNEGGAA